jgi:hypothetical protein
MMGVEMNRILDFYVFHTVVEDVELDASSNGKASLIEPD